MNKRLLSLTAALCTAVFAMAQSGPSLRPASPTSSLFVLQDVANVDTSWKTGGALGFNLNQTYLSNWAAGGQSAVALTGLFNLFGNYAKDRFAWSNSLDVAYGVLSPDFKNSIKNDDRFEFNSKAGLQLANKENWFYSALLNFRTQMATGFLVEDGIEVKNGTGKISNALAPGYLTFALGGEYKPNDNFYVLIAPASFKGTIVNDQDLADAGAFGVDAAVFNDLGTQIVTPGANFRGEIGGTIQSVYKHAFAENINFQTSLNLFSNYLENPQNIDINWQNLLAIQIGKAWNVNFTTTVLYDDDINLFKDEAVTEIVDGVETITKEANIGPGVQFKETFALGFGYQF